MSTETTRESRIARGYLARLCERDLDARRQYAARSANWSPIIW